MKKIKFKKIIAMLMLLIIILSCFSNYGVLATEISEAYIEDNGTVPYHLQYWNSSSSVWSYVITTYTTYTANGVTYPAYCLNSDLSGVGEVDSYTVTVDELLDNDAVWRTIINGFPYKSASELGLDSDLYAFQATKQAIYCILYDYDPETRFRSAADGADEIGDAIRTAIINMVDAGRNGTQTPADALITLTASGDLYEDGDYYTQKIDVSSEVDISNYYITSTANLPSGTIITNSSGTETTSFTGTESMYVKIPKSQLSEDISNAIINVQGKCKTYPVFYRQNNSIRNSRLCFSV